MQCNILVSITNTLVFVFMHDKSINPNCIINGYKNIYWPFSFAQRKVHAVLKFKPSSEHRPLMHVLLKKYKQNNKTADCIFARISVPRSQYFLYWLRCIGSTFQLTRKQKQRARFHGQLALCPVMSVCKSQNLCCFK